MLHYYCVSGRMSLVMAISDGNIIVVMPPTVTCHTPRSVDSSRGAAHRAELQDPKPWCVLFCVESSARGLWQSVHFCFIRSLFWSYLLAIIKCSICSSRLMVPRCAAATRTSRQPDALAHHPGAQQPHVICANAVAAIHWQRLLPIAIALRTGIDHGRPTHGLRSFTSTCISRNWIRDCLANIGD